MEILPTGEKMKKIGINSAVNYPTCPYSTILRALLQTILRRNPSTSLYAVLPHHPPLTFHAIHAILL
jgi:hypothetical protein